MNLLDYLKTLDKGTAGKFAECCGTSLGQLRQVAYGNRRASASLAINIERHSCGQVVCEQLRPDVDWGYLRAKSTAA
ncbi:YdaS family helix-turn-helix protein [Ectopseudomonas khazarica]|uniref:YdaS family helix-turn-helix protein n=1 Tax=Ectopseudomonas khazarica TaxID=2502979 RepID=UPI003A90B7F6